jgi:drug/metabolite transporter (DMT)-like permease
MKGGTMPSSNNNEGVPENISRGNDPVKPLFGLQPAYLLMLVVTFFWAIGHPLGALIVKHLHPFQLGGANLVIGFICVFAFLLFSGKLSLVKSMKRGDILYSLLLGVFGFFIYNICTFSALARIPASMNAVLVATNVLFITVIAALVLKEKLSLAKVLFIFIAAGGAVLVIFNQGFRLTGTFRPEGSLFSLAGALSFAVYTVLGKRILERNDPLMVTTLSLFSGAVLLVLLTTFTTGFSQFMTLDGQTWLYTIIVGVGMIGIAYPLWFWTLKKVKASHIAIFIYLTPVFATLLSYFILNETFSPLFYLGTVLILGGIILINTLGSRVGRNTDFES